MTIFLHAILEKGSKKSTRLRIKIKDFKLNFLKFSYLLAKSKKVLDCALLQITQIDKFLESCNATEDQYYESDKCLKKVVTIPIG